MKTAKWILLISSAIGLIYALTRGSEEYGGGIRQRISHWHDALTDINSADEDALKKLGLDEVAAGRIVENRPYRNKLELVSRMIIPEKLYGTIRHQIGVRDAGDAVKVA